MRHKSSDLVRFLLEHDADPTLENEDGKTPLHTLLWRQDTSFDVSFHRPDYILIVAQLLIEHGADVNSRDKSHETPLFLAMRHKSSDLVRFLLEHGADPNSEIKDGKNPLHRLIGPQKIYSLLNPDYHCSDYVLVVSQLLLERGADVNSRDMGHETPLHLAMRHKSSDLVRYLLERGADPNLENEAGKTPLHTLLGPQTIHTTSKPDYHRSDHLLVVTQLLLERGANVNSRDKDHETPLHLAMRLKKTNFTRFLLENGADPNLENEDGKTPLHMLLGPPIAHTDFSSCYHDDDYIFIAAQLLVEHSANVNAQDDEHKTPSLLALKRQAFEIASFLLERGANPNMENHEGDTPLHTLLLERDTKNNNGVLIFQLLLKYGADTGARNKKNLATPLDLAPYYGKVSIAQVLLGHVNKLEGRNVGMNVQDTNYAAQLRLACYCGRLDIVQELLNHGANPKSENFQGENPLHLLSQGDHDSHEDSVRIAQELLARAVPVDARSKCHRTPLHLASYFGRPAIVQVLLDFGAKPDATDGYGETPLHLLSRGKCDSQDDGVSVARLLLKFGADINAPDVENRTPLHHASYNGVVAIAQLLLEHGGKPNAADRNGETPLHLALQGKDDSEEYGIGITRLLLEHGADVDAQDNYHVTPLDLSSHVRPKIANVLLEHGADVFFIVRIEC
ncbi:Ankyrin repeat-containing domain protein [Lactarius tabidus]